MKKIVWGILGGYCACLALGLGMLKAAQETRRLLYGGKPVMAAVQRRDAQETVLTLGGGEWKIALPAPESKTSRSAAFPPCTFRLVMRILELTDQTAEVIGRIDALIS